MLRKIVTIVLPIAAMAAASAFLPDQVAQARKDRFSDVFLRDKIGGYTAGLQRFASLRSDGSNFYPFIPRERRELVKNNFNRIDRGEHNPFVAVQFG